MNDFNRLKCPTCQRFYKNSDPVILDVLNTVIHMKCYRTTDFPIKDRGIYREIIDRYDFFHDLQIFN